ncbi:Ionotropic receptor 75d [Carabus blaptoides fortunei]
MGQGFAIEKPRILARIRQNLNGTLFRSSIVITNNDTVNHLHDYRHKHIDTITKVNYVFTNHLIDMVNGTREFFYVNSWGYKNKNNNSYTGMIGTLQRHEAEIGGTALFLTADRVPIIEYASMTTPTRAKFVFRQPPLSYVTNVFTLPFTRAVWISSFLLIGLAAVLLYTTVFWEWHQPNLEESSNAMDKSFSDAVMLTIAAVAQQGSTSEPRSAAGKIVMIFTFIALMFLYVSYSANIVALLQSSATNIRSLEDLLKSRLKLGIDDTVYNHYYFETATEPVRKAIYEQKVAPVGQKPRYMTMESGVGKMRQGFFAFHMELGAGYKLVGDTFLESEKCGLQEIPYLQVVDPYLAIKKNSSYKEMLKIGLRKIQESGIQSRELQKLYTKKPECHTGGGNFVSVGLIDAYPAFLVLIAGLESYFLPLKENTLS